MKTLKDNKPLQEKGSDLTITPHVKAKSFQDYFKKPEVSYPKVKKEDETFLKSVYVQSWGCQMNTADTERMLALLGQLNYRKTDSEENADLFLLNTCHIREKARHKVVSRLGELKKYKVKDPHRLIIVAGCVAQAESEKLSKEVPFVDLIFGPDKIESLPKLLETVITLDEEQSLESKKHPQVHTGFDKKSIGYSIPIDVVPPYKDETASQVSRYVNIIKGCNNFCTFCVVPFTRGREKSRTLEEITSEVKYLVKSGTKEVVLLGQNVNSYGLDLIGADDTKNLKQKLPFSVLLHAVSDIDDLKRVRFTTSNPHDFTDDILDVFKTQKKVINSFHLPVQSGSDRVLKKMNRQYTRDHYLDLASKIRTVRPKMAFGTDIIVGFPGESDNDFEETLTLVEKMKYAYAFAFKYSIRKGTPAARFKDQVPETLKDKRLQKLLSVINKETLEQNKNDIGKELETLILYKNKKEENSWYGRSYEGRLIKVGSKTNILGETLNVKITDANQTALVGQIL